MRIAKFDRYFLNLHCNNKTTTSKLSGWASDHPENYQAGKIHAYAGSHLRLRRDITTNTSCCVQILQQTLAVLGCEINSAVHSDQA
jgi:hypothetical protein